MSQAHIPQPNTQAAAPAEAFDSTADAPHGQTVSGIGVPAGPPQEIPAHTGAQNTFDITIHRQFIPMDTVTWSTSQVKGTLIWFTPVHPSRANPILSYLTPLYNTWGGSLEYNFKIAGTGFHAGAIAIVRIPPNRHPSEFSTPSSWGPFEYVVMDPKMLEVASLEVSDQRPISFHYNPLNQKDSYSFGGYLAMYVLIPLNTSSTGSQQIAVQVFNRPGSTFQFSQLITPYIDTPTTAIPHELDAFLDFDKFEVNANAPIYVTDFCIRPDTIKETDRGFNCFSLDTKPMSKYSTQFYLSASVQSDPTMWPGHYGVKIKKEPFTYSIDFKAVPAWQYQPNATATVVVFNGEYAATVPPGKYNTTAGDSEITLVGATNTSFEGGRGSVFFGDFLESTWGDNNYSAKAPNESFAMVRSAGYGSPIYCFQTSRFAQACYNGLFSRVTSPDQCMLFVLRDKSENLNVGYVKLYSEGFFTCRGVAEEVIYPAGKMQLVFDSYILRTDPIPYNATYNLNALAVQQKYALSRFSSAQKASFKNGHGSSISGSSR